MKRNASRQPTMPFTLGSFTSANRWYSGQPSAANLSFGDGPRDLYCKSCCRLLHWFINPRQVQPQDATMWQAVCCGEPHYEQVRGSR